MRLELSSALLGSVHKYFGRGRVGQIGCLFFSWPPRFAQQLPTKVFMNTPLNIGIEVLIQDWKILPFHSKNTSKQTIKQTNKRFQFLYRRRNSVKYSKIISFVHTAVCCYSWHIIANEFYRWFIAGKGGITNSFADDILNVSVVKWIDQENLR